jgi:NAD(P)-dependent dehydrogenase (short-subunit alcohol dehydrogenase family)
MPTSESPIILITGATSGIGWATARDLLHAGGTVIVHGPTRRSAEQAAARLAVTGINPNRIVPVGADFSRLAEVADLARSLSDQYERIDVVVNNAAIAPPVRRTVTDDGNEVTFQVNYLAPCVLTRLLTPQLRAAHGRMVAVSSSLHRTVTIDWNDPQRQKRYSPGAAYAQSKLGLSMFARALADVDVTAVSVHPGVVETDLRYLYGHIGHPVEEAAAVLARLSSPDVEVINGAYYDGPIVSSPAPMVDDAAAVARLWKLTSRLLDRHVALIRTAQSL